MKERKNKDQKCAMPKTVSVVQNGIFLRKMEKKKKSNALREKRHNIIKYLERILFRLTIYSTFY